MTRPGLCECGCEQPTSIATRTRIERGDIAGQPVRFVRGHSTRVEERFVIREGPLDTPCHVSTVNVDSHGYGFVRVDGKARYAHVVAWEAVHGPVPDGLELDHLCRVRACRNPAHLEAVTHRVNCLRGTSPTAVNARKTHCAKGHEYTPENTYRYNDGRDCRTCRRARRLAYERRKKAELTRRRAIAGAGQS